MHVHVSSPDGEAKLWLEPEISVARNYGLSEQDLNRVRKLVANRQEEIRDAWNEQFGS
jgi:hypothetical protein